MCLLWYFQEYNQTSKNIFRNIFWNATKHMKIFSFLKNSIFEKHLFSKNTFTRKRVSRFLYLLGSSKLWTYGLAGPIKNSLSSFFGHIFHILGEVWHKKIFIYFAAKSHTFVPKSWPCSRTLSRLKLTIPLSSTSNNPIPN